MRKILCLAFVAGAACGGGPSSPKQTTPEPPPPPPCAPMAQHMRDLVVKAGQEDEASADMLAKLGPVIERVTAERCQADAWSAEVIACVNAADEESMDPCIDQLTDEQQKALETQIENELEPILQEELEKAGVE